MRDQKGMAGVLFFYRGGLAQLALVVTQDAKGVTGICLS